MTSATAGVNVTFSFNGTGVKVVGIQDSCSGQARVQVDGHVDTFDAYRANDTVWQQTLYSLTGLPAGNHTVTLTVLGQKQAASCARWIYIDGFDVVVADSNRIEESDPRLVRGPGQYNWNDGTDGRASAGGYMVSATSGVYLSFGFSGTGVRVIGIQDSCSGVAQVEVDGNMQTFDAYRGDGTGGWQRVLYSLSGLPPASHTLTLTVLGQKQAASCGAWIYIDAFDVM